jgi:hypothetical protein
MARWWPSTTFHSTSPPANSSRCSALRVRQDHLLGILGGFVQPSSGAALVGERDITFAPPHKRDIGIVF